MQSRILSIFGIAVLTLLFTTDIHAQDIFLGEKNSPGFVRIRDDIEMFYWLFKARNNKPKAPLIIWLEGGPGCCSEEAIFMENGPFRIANDSFLLSKNYYSWTNMADVIFIDQPVGTGFTNAAPNLMATDKEQLILDFMQFYNGFLQENSEYLDRDLYIAGQSYGGHFVPYYAKALVDEGFKVKGIAIGNGYYDASQVYYSYPHFSYAHNLISTYEYFTSLVGSGACSLFIKFGWLNAAQFACTLEQTIIEGQWPNFHFNPIDIRPHSKWISTSHFDEFITQPSLKDLIGVGEKSWANCNFEVQNKLIKDQFASATPELKELLGIKDLKVVLYYGEEDFVCNILSGETTLRSLGWIYEDGVIPDEDWRAVFVNNEEKAKCVGGGGKLLCKVHGAGHLAIWNQPQWADYMITQLLFKP